MNYREAILARRHDPGALEVFYRGLARSEVRSFAQAPLPRQSKLCTPNIPTISFWLRGIIDCCLKSEGETRRDAGGWRSPSVC